MPLKEIATIETDLFEHREVKPYFINECCFGEDFADWLRRSITGLAGFKFSDPIQEDYGWGFWATHGQDKFWVVMSYMGDGPTELPAQWVVSISSEAGLNVFKMLFAKPDLEAMEKLRARIREVLETTDGITIIIG
jgi:hypothetical protein